MDKREIEIKKQLIKKRNIVKQKLNVLKEGNLIQEQSFFPITHRLETIAEKLNGETNIKSEPSENVMRQNTSFTSPQKSSTKHKKWKTSLGPSFLDSPVVAEINSNDNLGDHENNDDDDMERSIVEAKEYIKDLSNSPDTLSYLNKFDPLPRQYVHNMISDVDNKFDFRYGVRYDPDHNELKIGNAPIQFDGKDLVINGLTYTGTPGLYELLFKKQPLGFKESDKLNYLDIVKRTNANRRNYSEDEQIQGSTSDKYKNIISALNIQPLTARRPKSIISIARKRLGSGMLNETSNNPIEYVRWDDPNELVNRLRLLVASQTAGHTGHANEIISIIEELREARIIE